jgi:hypothetical protein
VRAYEGMGTGHIDDSDVVAAKCKPSSTLADPLHRNE